MTRKVHWRSARPICRKRAAPWAGIAVSSGGCGYPEHLIGHLRSFMQRLKNFVFPGSIEFRHQTKLKRQLAHNLAQVEVPHVCSQTATHLHVLV